MAKLVWDEAEDRLYETGVNNAVLYTDTDDEDGAYKKATAWNGITAVTESPEGAEANDQYADNIKYLSLRSAENFKATIEAFMYPDEFAECDGMAEIVPGVMIGQQNRKRFGLAYKTILGNAVDYDGHGYKLHLIYGCTVSPSEKAYQTVNDSPEAITFSWEIDTVPVNVTVNGVSYKPTASITIDSTKFTTEAAKAKLAALEDKLFGSSTTEAYLPMPSEVYSTLTA